ncbi:MAG: hypothetical protein UT91_C0035G0003 [Parcubacteria group bacterium GW2011_GWA2_40_23]|nr:MAG: hypothetical protein UT91_C0035G0003 [Parcubacteria group bacterium GW2011_GWA2_40_23]
MGISFGSWRLVLALPNLGIVIKFPFPLCNIGNVFIFWRCAGAPKSFKGINYLVRGIVKCFWKAFQINWHEFTYYRQSRHPILQPTHFSFLGLFNIQRYGLPCRTDNWNLPMQIDIITNDKIKEYCDPHHFQAQYNFNLVGGKLHIHDYGDVQTQQALDHFADILYEDFDPNREVNKDEWETVRWPNRKRPKPKE